RNGIVIFDNLVYNVQYAGIRFNTTLLSAAKIYNNTFYATNLSGNTDYGLLTNDLLLPLGAASLENNIFWPANNMAYTGGGVGLAVLIGSAANNIFYGGSGPTLGASLISANPMFISASDDDFQLATGSPAIGAGATDVASVVTTDYALVSRSRASVDIGALAAALLLADCAAVNLTPASSPDRGSPAQDGAPPTISGTPATTVQVGATYSFRPAVADSGRPVKFSIENPPPWTQFSAKSGA